MNKHRSILTLIFQALRGLYFSLFFILLCLIDPGLRWVYAGINAAPIMLLDDKALFVLHYVLTLEGRVNKKL